MKIIEKKLIENFPGIILCFSRTTGKIHYLEGVERDRLFPDHQDSGIAMVSDFRRLIPGDDRNRVEHNTKAWMTEGKSWEIEYPIGINGNRIWLQEKSFIFTNENNETDICLYLVDISESKKEIENANQLARSKNEFFASMSHEIRTPMNAVMGMAQILGNTQLDVEQRQYVNTIVASSNALVQIINDILDLSKLEVGKVELSEDEYKLESLCLEVCQLLATRAQEKELKIYLNYLPVKVKTVLVDKGRLRQILVNLLGNAIKFTHSGYVELTVDVKEHGSVPIFSFAIKDTGIGISESARQRLFSAFGQADNTISQNYGGTGLGLLISQRLVELLGGSINVESREGVGSIFSFDLPLEILDEGDIQQFPGKRCLLAVDDANSKAILEKVFNIFGISIVVVSNLIDLDTLHQINETFDFVIIDSDLNGTDSLNMSRAIKQRRMFENASIILLNTIGAKEDSITLFEAGVNVYMHWPICPSLIYQALDVVTTGKVHANKAIYISNDNRGNDKTTLPKKIRASGKALIAEDVEVNQFILKSMLSEIGLDVDIAENGKEAVDAVSANDFDIIFMDCRMPVMDGYAATKYIKSMSPPKSDIPIIALTANASEQDKKVCVTAGMNDFLAKPYVEKDIVDIISNWLETEIIETSIESNSDVDEYENEILDHVQFASIKDSLQEEFSNFAMDITDKFLGYQHDIIEALKRGDMGTVLEKGHSLKGIAAMIGARQVSEIGYSIEQAGSDEDIESAIMALSKLDSAIAKVHSMIIISLNPDIDKSLFLV